MLTGREAQKEKGLKIVSDFEAFFQRGVRDLNTSRHPSDQVKTTETHTSSPSGEPTAGADFRERAGQQRDKRDSAPLPALAVAALLAAVQRLRDDAADPLLQQLVASVFGGNEALNAAERAGGLVLVRHASREQLAALWSDAASRLEGYAAHLCAQAQATGHPAVTARPHNSDEQAGSTPGPVPLEVAPGAMGGRAP
jgi:hypothetical protein